jgi:hypothetical protein
MQQMKENSRLLTIARFADECGIAPKTAKKMIDSGQVPTVSINGRSRVVRAWLEEWLRSGQQSVSSSDRIREYPS